MALTITAALLPVLVLLGFILCKDRARPEPPRQLLMAFALGVCSVVPALVLAGLFVELGLASESFQTAGEAVCSAFWGAAIPEELAKLLMLWLVLRRNPFFDEKMDGIVYAVCVSLGFAAAENLMYLFGNEGNALQVGVSRALFAIPGHFCDGVLMGYYYSLARFGTRACMRHRACILVAPVLAHGLYDSLLFLATVSELLSGILSTLFYLFCYQLWRYASRRITRHLEADGVLPRP